uniref:Uncharacterized protein n=1 Tax=Dromaius novaehollandiae TaxID=8790 RepID=A0A8C4KFV6_DRONO
AHYSVGGFLFPLIEDQVIWNNCSVIVALGHGKHLLFFSPANKIKSLLLKNSKHFTGSVITLSGGREPPACRFLSPITPSGKESGGPGKWVCEGRTTSQSGLEHDFSFAPATCSEEIWRLSQSEIALLVQEILKIVTFN